MKVLLVRHGESANNAMFKHLEKTRPNDTREQLLEEWRKQRSEDPQLTIQGVEQGKQVSQFYSNILHGQNVFVYSSPTLRGLQTADQFVKYIKIAEPVNVLDTLYERDGIYHTYRNVISKSKTELETMFPQFNYSLLKQGSWYKLDHKETPEEAEERSRRIVNTWLLSDSFINQHMNDVVVLIVHRELMSLILEAFVNGKSNISFFHDNTATSLINIQSKDDIEIKWVNRFDHIDMSQSRAFL